MIVLEKKFVLHVPLFKCENDELISTGVDISDLTDCLSKSGFDVIGIFDKDPSIIGETVKGMPILSVDTLDDFCKENHPVAAVICVPEAAARQNVEMLVENGVMNFWNFSHFDIAAEFPGTISENVHLNDSLRTLNYQITHKRSDDE